MVPTNQRNIYEGIRKVIGSSNRGFASIDPERQGGIVTQGGKSATDTTKVLDYPPNQVREAASKRTAEGSSSR